MSNNLNRKYQLSALVYHVAVEKCGGNLSLSLLIMVSVVECVGTSSMLF